MAKASKRASSGNVTIVKKMRDYSNESAFVKKTENAIRFIEKNGLPKSGKRKNTNS